MRKCKECGRRMPFPVSGKRTFGKTYYFCGFCCNPMSFEWIKRYAKWLEKKLENYEPNWFMEHCLWLEEKLNKYEGAKDA